MSNIHQERQKQFSDLIKQEHDKTFDALISSLAASISGKPDNTDIRQQTREEKTAMLTLHALKCHEEVFLYQAGNLESLNNFLEDWEVILDCVKYLSYNWELTNDVISFSSDLVLLLNPTNRKAFLQLIGKDYANKVHDIIPLSEDVFWPACGMIEYCYGHGLEEYGVSIASNLVDLSKVRNATSPGRHRETVTQALWYVVDVDTAEAIKIGSENAHVFAGISDETTARFCWMYGFALNSVGDVTSVPFFERCFKIYQLLEGEKSWPAARAAAMYNYSLIDSRKFEEAERFLWRFLKRVDEAYYINTDETVDYFAAYTRYVLLTGKMEHGSLRGLLPEIDKFYSYCKSTEKNSGNPRLTVRAAENIYSGYFMEMGEHLTAAQHAENALNSAPPNGLTKIPSDDIVYSNLLNIYSQLNDIDKMDELSRHLMECSESFDGDRGEYYRLCVLLDAAAEKIGVPVDDRIDTFKESLSSFYNEKEYHTKKWRDANETDTGYALWLFANMSHVLDSFSSSRTELQYYYEIVEHILSNPDVYAFHGVQKASAYMIKTQILWQLKDLRAISSAQECLKYSSALAPTQEALISMKRFIAVVFNSFGRIDLAEPVVLETLESVTSAWHKAVSFLNDHRVCQVLAYIQHYYDICYAILKQAGDTAGQYDQILRFKNLPALVGRERNRFLKSAPIDENLKSRIFDLQDKLAAAQIDDAIRDDNTSAQIINELQRLEAQFATEFPQNLKFTEISVNRVFNVLQSNDLIVEYYFSYNRKALSGFPSDSDNLELEIYLLFKENGKNRILRLINAGGDRINERAADLISFFQDNNALDKQEAQSVRAYLHQCLVEPILPYVKKAGRVFLAPDMALCNLPIETITGNDGTRLSDYCQVTRLVCGRDILFFNGSESNVNTNFVLGNPDYDLGRSYRSGKIDEERKIGAGELAESLPFTEREAISVGLLCKCEPCIRKQATKYSLQKALPCRIIHLSTHGAVDESMESDSLYSSVLLFAGYNKWLLTGSEDSQFGNGILTADEISRMDLSQTELVVLSACQSGLGDISFGGVQGLLSAFSAAGAKWIICHMWKANDFASAVLMESFYRAYLLQKMSVPSALQKAKEYVRGVTIKQLNDSGWLQVPNNLTLNADAEKGIKHLKAANERRTPFNDEEYWGGFVCYQCR